MTTRQGIGYRRPAGRRVAGQVVLIVACAAVMSCVGELDADADGRLRVVATTGMIADLAARIGGADVVVEGLMGPGVDPHLYRASAGDVRRLARADLILYNGLHLEAAMGEVLEEMGRRKHTVAVTDGIDSSLLAESVDYPGSWDPHVWFDVRLWMEAARAVTRALEQADTVNAGAYRTRSVAVLADLEALDDWVRSRAAELRPETRVLVTAHDAFGYFGRAYGFEVRGLQGISTAAEAGTADVQQLAAEIARRRIPAVFVETSIPRRTIEAVQAAVRSRGFQVEIGPPLYSDALGTAGTPEATYVGMVRHNVNAIVDALKGGP